jgi:hypothetical protein
VPVRDDTEPELGHVLGRLLHAGAILMGHLTPAAEAAVLGFLATHGQLAQWRPAARQVVMYAPTAEDPVERAQLRDAYGLGDEGLVWYEPLLRPWPQEIIDRAPELTLDDVDTHADARVRTSALNFMAAHDGGHGHLFAFLSAMWVPGTKQHQSLGELIDAYRSATEERQGPAGGPRAGVPA